MYNVYIYTYVYYDSKRLINYYEKTLACTVCQRSSDPFYIVNNYMNCVTISWSYSTLENFLEGIFYIS